MIELIDDGEKRGRGAKSVELRHWEEVLLITYYTL